MRKKHPYHCVLCGTQLEEEQLGVLVCPSCNQFFLPIISGEDNSLHWFNKNEVW